MFSCEQVLAELSSYLDDELVASLRKQVEEHVVHCRNCRAVYDSTRKTLRIVTESEAFDLAEDLSSRIVESIRARANAQQRGPDGASRS
jgi:predicted anti-sigma-YlaC factor YlaD